VRALIKSQQDDARARIQVGNVIERVKRIAAGEAEGDPATLAVQLRASELLLRKTLPDLSSVEMTGAEGGPLTITINKIT
jgi:hypothetical protein